MHRLSVDLLGVILIKSVGLMFGTSTALKPRDAVAKSVGTVNSVCLPWWTVLTGRMIHKRRLRHCLDSKSACTVHSNIDYCNSLYTIFRSLK